METTEVIQSLMAKCSAENASDNETLLVSIEDFINTCGREQAKFAVEGYIKLVQTYTKLLVKKEQPLRGIVHLCKAIERIQAHSSQLTQLHADLCQLCLLAKCFKPALPYLNMEINNISRNLIFDVKYSLLYYYYGGMIYAALKNWERALYFFEVALTTPSMAISMIMIEAYKKYALIALIVNGKLPNLPKYTSPIVNRLSKALSAPYKKLIQAYEQHNPDELNSVISKYTQAFTTDNNLGLVKQCLTSLHKKNIQRLTKTFLTLSLEDMTERVQLSSVKEAESYILKMIEDGEIFASINQKDGMVIFLDNPEKYNTSVIFRRLEDEMRNCMVLDENLRKMNHDIAVNPKYIHRIRVEPE